MAGLNREWHLEHRMPINATAEERIRWHREHAKACGCRPIPKGVIALMAERGELPGAEAQGIRWTAASGK